MLNLESVLTNLNTNYSSVIDLIPNRYNFTDDYENAGASTPFGDVVFAQADGKVLWAGQSNFSIGEGSGFKNNIVRFNTDGSIDESFTCPIFDGDNSGYIRDIGQQSDGKLIIVGHFTSINGDTYNRIARLNTDGSVDSTFANGLTGFGNTVLVLKVLQDDSMLVGGNFSAYNGVSTQNLVKLDSEGVLDTTFDGNIGGAINAAVHAIKVFSGSIFVGGQFTNGIIKLGSDGTPDATFVVGTGFNKRVSGIEVQSDGKVLVGGWFNSYDGTSCRKVVRLTTTGSLDETFDDESDFNEISDNGTSVQNIHLLADGKVLVCGWFTSYGNATDGYQEQRFIAKLNTNGTLDSTFDVARKFAFVANSSGNKRVQNIIFSNNKLFMAHNLYQYGNENTPYFTATDADGVLLEKFILPPFNDPNFDLDDNDIPLGLKIKVMPDGSVLWAGISDRDDQLKVVRKFLANGDEDPDFNLNYFSGEVRDFDFQSDGKIIVVGDFSDVNNIPLANIARLNADGSLDSTFIAYQVTNNGIWCVKVLGDDRIFIGGQFTQVEAQSTNYVAILTANGDLDSFSSEGAIDSHVMAVAVDSDGEFYIGGKFTGGILKLNADLTVDNTFTGGFSSGIGSNPRVSSIQIDTNGKLVVGHWFTEYQGNPCSPGISRLLTNGDLDDTFATEGTGLAHSNNSGLVQAVRLQSDGKVLVGGWFDLYNGEPQRKLIRLNTDGSKDTTFDIGYGFGVEFEIYNGSRIQSIDVDSDGNVFCTGGFASFQHIARYPAIKLTSTGSLNNSFSAAQEVYFAGISDGGGDMYDGGNLMYTNLRQLFDEAKDGQQKDSLAIPVTHTPVFGGEGNGTDLDNGLYVPVPDGRIKDGSPYFGEGSTYFTNMYEGMFVMCASNVQSSVNEFFIAGNTGADGDGDIATITVNAFGNTYTAFVKRTYNSGDPSINQIIIIPGNGEGVQQLISEDTNDDDHAVLNISANEIFYVLVASADSGYIDNDDMTSIITKFLEVIGAGQSFETYTLNLTNPSRAVEGADGSLDQSIIDGKSIQRDGYMQTTEGDATSIKISRVKDGSEFTNKIQTLSDLPWIVGN